jgi:serine/threonine protein kinase/tetratricopeptide (TPR) repeat protein
MGEVYEVNDTALNEHVALKIISPEISSDERAILRFKREIQLARKITHPNVCRIFDVGYHQGERNEASFVFLTMELLEGCTLADRIYSLGQMSTSAAFPVVAQLAAGLDAAHQAGVVHRDFKCGNVMLVPVGTGTRAVITDFGLARGSTTIDTDPGSISAADEIVGTPDYMSPEQIKGAPAKPTIDIYALGMVMYVALTRRLAFEGATPRQRALKRLEETPPSPRTYVEDLDGKWEKAILQCLSKYPEDRPQSGAAVLKVIRGEQNAGFLLRPRYLYAAALALMLALVAIPSIRHRLWNRSSKQAAPEMKQLAVLPFSAVNADDESIAFAKGLGETLTAQLSKLTEKHALQVIPAAEIRSNHVEDVSQARREFGVNLALEGSVERAGPKVRVSYHIVDARNAHQLHGETITAPASDPFSLEDDVAASVARALEIELNPQEKSVLASPRTTEPAAYDFFLTGRGYLQDYLRPGNLDSAISVFDHAVELDAKYAPAYAGLGQAYWYKYEATRDRAWIDSATQNCAHAVQLDEQSAESHNCLGIVYQGTGKYELAVFQFQRAIEFDPTSDAAVRGLASSYASLGKTNEAEAAYRRAVALRPQYWRGYNMLGAFYSMHSRYDEAAKMFRQVIDLAPDNYRGYSNFGAIHLIQGRYTDAIPMFERAASIQPTAEAYSNLATTYFYLRRFPEAASMYAEAVKLNDRNYVMWGNLADAEYRIPGKGPDAELAYKTAIKLAEQELQVNPNNAVVLGNLADYYSVLGDKERSLRYVRESLARAPDDASVAFKAAQVYDQLGQNETATEWLMKAVAAGYSPTIVRDSPVLDNLRSDPRVQALLHPR